MNMIKMTCRCGKTYEAREADVKRGWGKSCSKRCAAVKRTRQERAGNHKLAEASAKYRDRPGDREIGGRIWDECSADQSWDAHKQDACLR